VVSLIVIPIPRFVNEGSDSVTDGINSVLPLLPILVFVLVISFEDGRYKRLPNFWNYRLWLVSSICLGGILLVGGLYQDINEESILTVFDSYRGGSVGFFTFALALYHLRPRFGEFKAFILSAMCVSLYLGLWEFFYQPIMVWNYRDEVTSTIDHLLNTWITYQLSYIVCALVVFYLFYKRLGWKLRYYNLVLVGLILLLVSNLTWVCLGLWIEVDYNTDRAIHFLSADFKGIENYVQVVAGRLSKVALAITVLGFVINYRSSRGG